MNRKWALYTGLFVREAKYGEKKNGDRIYETGSHLHSTSSKFLLKGVLTIETRERRSVTKVHP